MFKNIIKTMIDVIWKFFKLPLKVCAVFIIVILLMYLFYYLYLRYYKGIEPKPNNGDHVHIKKDNIFKKVNDAIKQLAIDKLTADPARYKPKTARIICFVGRQGRGKTIAMTKFLRDEQAEWPHLKVATNYEYKQQNREITHWKQLVTLRNGKKGYAIALDEAQLWFNGRDFRNFDINMLQEIVFQRKQNKLLLLTTQVFSALDKNIKTQVQEIHYCHTIAGVFTWVVVKEPFISASTGEIEKEKFRRIYCFNQTEELRKSYDTFKMIDNLKNKGFVDRNEQLGRTSDNIFNVNIEEVKTKKR